MAAKTSARVFTYGLSPEADLWADQIESRGLEGVRFRLNFGEDTAHAGVPTLGRHSVHTALSAASVGLVEGLSLTEVIAGLREQWEQLRLVAVPGPAASTILDDTYNSSPASCIAALALLAELDGRKIAILGDMFELGGHEQEGHEIVGRRARDVADVLITVGELARIIGSEALGAGMSPEAVYQVGSNAEAIQLAQALIEEGDVVLVKGSRGMLMEEIVSALTQPTPDGRPSREVKS
jgi:UDP-N-acetylmuramoyl-tripeptide--D-alanyl-D-alanine ligase